MQRVRVALNAPLPPHAFWERWVNGVSIIEAMLYLWILALEVRFVGNADMPCTPSTML